MKNHLALVLFNRDLRIEDNPALFLASENCEKILPLFILDEKNNRKIGGAAKWFLKNTLLQLSKKLDENLVIKIGDSLEILSEIFSKNKISEIYFNSSFEPDGIRLEENIKQLCKIHSITVFSCNGNIIFDPRKIKNISGGYYKVFTPFWRECMKNLKNIEKTLPAPKVILTTNCEILSEKIITEKWSKKLDGIWEFDYEKIKNNYIKFLNTKVNDYHSNRNIPSTSGTSKLSPYIYFGAISAKQIFLIAAENFISAGVNQFLTEIGWREFCHHLLFHFPKLPIKNFRADFDKFPWQKNDFLLQKWQQGKTGYPIVDAGMRELWTTGFMHNRVRMIVASFLVKDLLIDWREGEKWFWECLVDADLANNTANWQWVAGSGADAAPYFRIFNPSLQGERFDKEGIYVKKWLPELSKLPNKFIHEPWKADQKTLEFCGIELGKNYPNRIVDHAAARDLALFAYKNLK